MTDRSSQTDLDHITTCEPRRNLPRSESQTLITGVYRTGTEYITHLLNAHPQLHASMYRVNVLRFAHGRFDPITEPAQWRKALDEMEQRIRTRYQIAINRTEIEAALIERAPITYGVLYDAVMTSLYLRDSKTHWAEKCQLLWREIPAFLDMMPNGRAILVIRDPRSVLASFKHITYAPPPAYLGGIFNCLDAMQQGLHLQATLPAERFTMVRYEDAARDPHTTARRLFRFLQLDDRAAETIFQHRDHWTDAYGRPWIANSAFHRGEADQPFDVEAAIHRWRHVLSPEEVGFTEAVCGPLMQQFGYELSNVRSDWLAILKLFIADEAMTSHVRRWILTREGIEEFPTDPLNPANWRNE